MTTNYIEHSTESLEFSGYHFHHNREPFYILFIKNDKKIYIEKLEPHSHRNKYVGEIVMHYDEMLKDECLKKFYDLAVMLVNTDKTIYYDTIGVETGQLVCPYDTDSEGKEGEEVVLRHWCINCDCNWKNLRVSKKDKCYYNMNPFTYEYNVSTEKEINQFMKRFNAFVKYNNIYPKIENMIIANYKLKLQMML